MPNSLGIGALSSKGTHPSWAWPGFQDGKDIAKTCHQNQMQRELRVGVVMYVIFYLLFPFS